MNGRPSLLIACTALLLPLVSASPAMAGDTVGAGAEWAHHGGGADESGHSRLDRITTRTIGKLGLAWWFDLGEEVTLEATPLAVDGVLYFTGGWWRWKRRPALRSGACRPCRPIPSTPSPARYNSHAFIVETFIDECAHAAGIDPLEYRLQLLSRWEKPWADCLRVAATHAGWGRTLPAGEGLGIAISAWPQAAQRNVGTIVATAAHVAVGRDGMIQVKKLDVAFDCGRVANRDAVAAQMEGGTLFGLSAALHEGLTLEDGRIAETNFDTYSILRLADAPPVAVHFEALSGHARMDIVGEAPVGPVAAAVGNAIFQATGKRLRTTPFIRHDLRWN